MYICLSDPVDIYLNGHIQRTSPSLVIKSELNNDYMTITCISPQRECYIALPCN